MGRCFEDNEDQKMSEMRTLRDAKLEKCHFTYVVPMLVVTDLDNLASHTLSDGFLCLRSTESKDL